MFSYRTLTVTIGSFCLTALVFINAFIQYEQFYPSMVYITKSSLSMAVLDIQAGVLVMWFAKLAVMALFGTLRASEIENLIEKLWYTVTETCLSFTVFRDDFSPRFVAQFTVLLLLKCFHWLAEDRIDYMERSPMISALYHFRALCLIKLLALFDIIFIFYAYDAFYKTNSVQLVFGFEYAILFVMIVQVLVKYILHAIDSREENSWEHKNLLLLYLELVLGFVKIVLYLAFLIVMVNVHTFPLFALRPLYQIIRNFNKAYNDVVMSRRAIYNMNHLYPDCTAEELASADVCIICREDMTSECKKLPCSHMFHKSCLRSWFQRQQTCPTCRMDIMANTTPTGARVLAPVAPPVAVPLPPAMPTPPATPRAPSSSTATTTTTTATTSSTTPAPAPSAGTTGASGAVPPHPAHFPHLAHNLPFSMPPLPVRPIPPPELHGVNHYMGMSEMLTPPPMPQHDLADLDEETLRRMEVEGREGLQARVQTLHDIHTLLDAAMLQMRLYTQIDARIRPRNQDTPPHLQATHPHPRDDNTATTTSSPVPPSYSSAKALTSSSATSPQSVCPTTPTPTTTTSTSSTPVNDTGKSPMVKKLNSSVADQQHQHQQPSTSAGGSSSFLSTPTTPTPATTTTPIASSPSTKQFADEVKDSVANDNENEEQASVRQRRLIRFESKE